VIPFGANPLHTSPLRASRRFDGTSSESGHIQPRDEPLPGGRFTAAARPIAVLLIAGAVLRLWAASGELWLDEIWSLSFARQMTSPWQVVTAIHHDNNHPLNTLWLFLTVKIAGAHAAALLFRLLSLATGVATMGLLVWTEREASEREGSAAPWIVAVLSALSFLGIVYSSEARGYAPVAFFATAAFACVRHRPTDTANMRLLFGGLCALGLLSHLTFLFVYAGLFAWTLERHLGGGRRDWRGWIALHRLPLVAIAGLYLIDARKLVYGGGPPFSVPEVVGRTLSLLAGGPSSGIGQLVAMVAAIGITIYGIAVIGRRRGDEAVFFATALLAPAGLLAIYQARYFDVRYFFVLCPFMWLLGARALAHLATLGPIGGLASGTLIVLSTAGQLINAAPLLREGRGHYMEVVETMARLTSGDEITVGSDNDFRNRVVLEYYAEQLPVTRQLTYVPTTAWTATTPEWVVTHSFGAVPSDRGATRVADINGGQYVPLRCVPYGGISGWNWCLHRLEDRRRVTITSRAAEVAVARIQPAN
jgi:hypothetical protein